nr:ABC transporter permease [uncultured Acidocella sp.]
MADLAPQETTLKALRKPSHFALASDRGWAQRFRLAFADLRDGAGLYRLIWALAFSEIKLRYRGSAIGPFWLTISTGIQIGAMAFLYADLFHTDIKSYLPYLAISLILWNYLSSLVVEGCTCFIGSEALLKGTRMPLVVHAVRTVLRNTIILAHNIIVVVAVLVIFQVKQTFFSLATIPGFALWLIDAVALSLLLGAICARFRDIPQIVAALMQVAFFLTPVIWQISALNAHPAAQHLIQLNPFNFILSVVRNPILGLPLTAMDVWGALAVSGFIIIVSLVGFARFRGRIAFWV